MKQLRARRFISRIRGSRQYGAAALCFILVAPTLQSAARAEPPAAKVLEIKVAPDLTKPAAPFEGWGTALAWFANVTGNWPDGDRTRVADLLYGPDGLGWTIARYNIGGGNASDTPDYLRPGAAAPGFWRRPAQATGATWWRPDDPAMWDWSADGGQRWWLDAVKQRVKAPIFEAFSNSPPWFMTVSGRVSGAQNATDDNLLPGAEQQFAEYLVRVVAELQRRHEIRFRTLSPINEPNTDYWFAANRQEGAHWSPSRQVAMMTATAAALATHRLQTTISAPDENTSHLFLTDWAAYPAATRVLIGQLNVHSYGTVHQTGVRDAARAANIRLWMSEADAPLDKDPENHDGIASALAFAEHVVLDLKRMEPSAWIFWQAIEDLSARGGAPGSNWGLIKTDFRAPAKGPHTIYLLRKYWAMAQFSRYIQPGYRLLPVGDLDSVAALSADGRTVVVVHVNGGLNPRRLAFGMPGWKVTATTTDATRECAPLRGDTAPARSITTFVLRR